MLAALRAAGFPPERVDVVVLSHLDGIGMTAVVTPDGGWAPAFPNARVVMTAAELEWLAGGSELAVSTGGHDALDALIAQGVVDGVDDGHRSPTKCTSSSRTRTASGTRSCASSRVARTRRSSATSR